jgi:CheY-like chemotaxis protein
MARTTRNAAASPKVLVIEDEFTNGEDLAKLLSGSELLVTAEDDIVEAVQRLRSEHWDLVVADAELLGVDGLVLMEMAREISQTLFLLVLGQWGPARGIAARRVGAAATLNKPVDPREFQRLARELIATGRAVDLEAELFEQPRSSLGG